jgi:ribosomal protein L17
MQSMDSTILKTPKKSLTDSQEKFLDALFGEAKGNPKRAGELAGYSEHSYPKVLRNLKSEIISRAEIYLATHSAKAATKMVDMLDEDGTTPQASIRMEAAKQILDRIGIAKKEKLDVNVKAMHGLFILPPKEAIKKVKPLDDDKENI